MDRRQCAGRSSRPPVPARPGTTTTGSGPASTPLRSCRSSGSPTTSTTCPPTSVLQTIKRAAVRHRAVLDPPQRHRQFPLPGFNRPTYQQQLTDEFDQLYAEGASGRRMMVIGCTSVSPGTPPGPRLDRIFTRLRYHATCVGAQRPDRPVGPRPRGHCRLGRPRPRPLSVACRPERLRPGIPSLASHTPPQGKEDNMESPRLEYTAEPCAISLICEMAHTVAPSPGRTRTLLYGGRRACSVRTPGSHSTRSTQTCCSAPAR